jgi:hypothetical protein
VPQPTTSLSQQLIRDSLKAYQLYSLNLPPQNDLLKASVMRKNRNDNKKKRGKKRKGQ